MEMGIPGLKNETWGTLNLIAEAEDGFRPNKGKEEG
jgi:hypothetical protein